MLLPQDKKLIRNVQVSDGIRFAGGSGFIRTRVLTFYVGEQGPFTATLDLVNYNPASIEAVYANEIASLRAAGIIPAQS
jgi:hypothetical protein